MSVSVAMKRILIVDDDIQLARLIQRELQARGFEIDIAENGIRALGFLSQMKYSVIILDLWMPELSGLELLEHLKIMNTKPVVIVITGGIVPESLDPSIVSLVMRKPLDPAHLAELCDTIAANYGNERAGAGSNGDQTA